MYKGGNPNLYNLTLVKNTIDTLMSWNATRQDTRVPADLPLIKQPTLVLWGSKDPEVPLTDGMLIAGLISGARLEIFEGAGHWPFLTHPERCASLILDFLM